MRAVPPVALLWLAVFVCSSDQNVLAPNLSDCARDLGLGPADKDRMLGGYLAAGLFLVGGPASIGIGAAADADGAVKRSTLLQTVLFLGSLGSAASALSASFTHLFIARSLSGVSLGGMLPLCFSLIGDLVDPSERTRVSGHLGLGMMGGMMSGQALAGALGPAFGWRLPFMVVAIASASLALYLRAHPIDPPRVGAPSARRPAVAGGRARLRERVSAMLGAWRGLLGNKTMWLVYLQGIPGCLPWGTIGTFLPDYLHANRNRTVREATAVLGAFTIGCAAGQLAGGVCGQRLFNRDARLPSLLMFGASMAGIVPMWLLIARTPDSLARCACLAAAGGFFASQTGPNVRAMLANVTSSQQRGLAFAGFTLADDLGKGAGPVGVAALIAYLGRPRALAVSMLGWLPCALICGLTAFTVTGELRPDEFAEADEGTPLRGRDASSPDYGDGGHASGDEAEDGETNGEAPRKGTHAGGAWPHLSPKLSPRVPIAVGSGSGSGCSSSAGRASRDGASCMAV